VITRPTLNQILHMHNPSPALYPRMGLALMMAVKFGDATAYFDDNTHDIIFQDLALWRNNGWMTPIQAYEAYKFWIAPRGRFSPVASPHGYS
jgi:hypothetical protein